MALNDIIVPKEGASGVLTEIALAPADIGAAPASHTHAISAVTDLQTALNGKQASGSYATLVGGTVPANQLPSSVATDFEITDSTKGMILKSPSNSRFRLSVDNDGILTTVKL